MSVAPNKSPKLEFPAGQRETFEIRTRLTGGRTLADFASFTLTVCEDPEFGTRTDFNTGDPAGEDWEEVDVDAEIEIDATEEETLVVSFTVPTDAGQRRYAFDVRGTLSGGGVVFLYPCTWLSVDVTC